MSLLHEHEHLEKNISMNVPYRCNTQNVHIHVCVSKNNIM